MPSRLIAVGRWVGGLGKAGLVGFAALLLVVTHWYAYNSGKQAEQLAADARLAEHLQRHMEQAEAVRQQDMEILTGTVQRETRVIREVERVEVPVSDCTHLGAEWLRGYNAVIDAARGAGASDDEPR